MKCLLLNKEEVQMMLKMTDAIASVEDAYITFVQGKLVQPPIVTIDVPEYNGELDIKSCYSKTDEIISIKSATGYWNNQKEHNIANLLATITLLDASTGLPLCIMDGSLITGYRTGAAGGLSAKFLSRDNSSVVGMIGAGNQARMQLMAIMEVRNIKTVHIWSRNIDEMLSYKKDMEKYSIEVVICNTPKEAVIKADIIVTTTPSKEAIIELRWIKSGTHIIAVGADAKGKQELETKIFKYAKVYVDLKAQCLSLGETRNAKLSGDIDSNDLIELGAVILNPKLGRSTSQEITIFDTTGMGIQDTTLSNIVYKKAIKAEIGTYYNFT